MKTNNLVYKTSKTSKDGTQYEVKVSLGDPCHNGYQDFAITGESYEAHKPRIEKYILCGGAIGNKIAKNFPEFQIFEDLHLCDFSGAPMYAVGNGFYQIKRLTKKEFCRYYNCNEKDYFFLTDAENEDHFSMLLYLSGLPKKWEAKANKAIKILEEWTGNEFLNDSKKREYIKPTAAEIKEYKEKEEAGQYTPEKIEERKAAKIADENNKKLFEIMTKRDKAIFEANLEFTVKRAVISANLPLNNFIYYNHSKKAVFNWKDYEDKVTQEQFDAANLKIEGVTFNLLK